MGKFLRTEDSDEYSIDTVGVDFLFFYYYYLCITDNFIVDRDTRSSLNGGQIKYLGIKPHHLSCDVILNPLVPNSQVSEGISHLQ